MYDPKESPDGRRELNLTQEHQFKHRHGETARMEALYYKSSIARDIFKWERSQDVAPRRVSAFPYSLIKHCLSNNNQTEKAVSSESQRNEHWHGEN